jgi:hypothetical protein
MEERKDLMKKPSGEHPLASSTERRTRIGESSLTIGQKGKRKQFCKKPFVKGVFHGMDPWGCMNS